MFASFVSAAKKNLLSPLCSIINIVSVSLVYLIRSLSHSVPQAHTLFVSSLYPPHEVCFMAFLDELLHLHQTCIDFQLLWRYCYVFFVRG